MISIHFFGINLDQGEAVCWIDNVRKYLNSRLAPEIASAIAYCSDGGETTFNHRGKPVFYTQVIYGRTDGKENLSITRNDIENIAELVRGFCPNVMTVFSP
jgi:hypothetical protein